MDQVVTICSGGLDSTTLAYKIAQMGYKQHLITFFYGQRHRKEIDAAAAIADRLDSQHSVIDISNIGGYLKGSSLTDSNVQVPEGYYAAETMRQTVVPNRNAIMLSIAWGIATSDKAVAVACGIHAGDHYIYPDCRPDFIAKLEQAFRLGTFGHSHDSLHFKTPFINVDKTYIVGYGLKIGVPYELTWTCYKGDDIACGRCGSCCERLEAFANNGAEDPLQYQDREYWRAAVKAGKGAA